MFYKGVLKNFTKFTGKHLCQSLILSKVRGLMPVNLLEKRLWRKCFLVNFKSSLRTPRCSRPEVLLGKGVLKICNKFTGEHPCRSAISIKLQSNFIEITLRHARPPVNLLHIFRTPFPRNTSWWLHLNTFFIEHLSRLLLL